MWYRFKYIKVLNLIINGLPSIREALSRTFSPTKSFKPYYKWITFNTLELLFPYLYLQ